MNRIIPLLLILIAQFSYGQLVTLSKSERISDGTDKLLYKIDPKMDSAEYIGEVEVDGFSARDTEIFAQVYKKAKTIGANGFSLKEMESIDGTLQSFNPNHYYLNLYEVKEMPKRDNTVYILYSHSKPGKLKINDKQQQIEPRSYLKLTLKPGEVVSIAMGGFLGSKIVLGYKENQPVQYYQLLPAGVRASNHASEGGLNLKSGDIIAVERSYAEFLTTIYSGAEYSN